MKGYSQLNNLNGFFIPDRRDQKNQKGPPDTKNPF